ncbi:TPA: hypothetical protein ACKP22_003833 [Pseudomonas putida]
MIRQKSSFQAFLLLFFYSFLIFILVSAMGVVLGAAINFFKIDRWMLEWSEILRLVPGALIYTVFATVGIWGLARLKGYKERKASTDKEEKR